MTLTIEILRTFFEVEIEVDYQKYGATQIDDHHSAPGHVACPEEEGHEADHESISHELVDTESQFLMGKKTFCCKDICSTRSDRVAQSNHEQANINGHQTRE